ncbi:MAG: site-2 protease family protein [Gemmatimonadales bacterium]
MGNLADGFVYYGVFLLSTTLHEAGHAWAAKLGGDLTAYHGGQVSLDPRPHIKREPVGMVVLPVISVLISGWPFGFASAPYDPRWAMQHPKRAAWMALAGPAANLLLIAVSGLLIYLALLANVFASPQSITFGHIVTGSSQALDSIAFVLGAFFSLNLVLLILNMLPIPPLDGSGALPLLLSDRVIPRYQQFIWTQPGLGLIGIIIAWQIFTQVFNPIFFFVVNILHPGVSYR